MLSPATGPLEFVGDVFTHEIAGLSLLKVTLAAVAVAAAIGVTRYAFNKALGNA